VTNSTTDLCGLNTIKIDICDEMIVIQCNNTEDLIATELEEMGIPQHKICLGFLPPEVRTLVNQPEQQRLLEPA
jgi:hypothetical protein